MKWLLPLLAVLLLSACGGGSSDGRTEERLVTDVQRFWTALFDGDAEVAYEYVPSQLQPGCPIETYEAQMLLIAQAFPPEYKDAEVSLEDVQITGDHATFTTVLTNGGVEVFRGEGEAAWGDGRWRAPVSEDSDPCGFDLGRDP